MNELAFFLAGLFDMCDMTTQMMMMTDALGLVLRAWMIMGVEETWTKLPDAFFFTPACIILAMPCHAMPFSATTNGCQ